ncbi:conserved hypothetical protein [Desulforamulus reducens MI-1]|uniref:DUF2815 family protein n=1 Tax=Desulforamulus reducens (strain ATCC BAA-1160 / DSM 100696 / MI-1) TaxID=349161 RepID=A4J3S0_DESRM|nr:DUF2815 family protein [Desulforamulus reducens]ABO49723.1 conserved hypothetical protein [Desulforamulus reducens MI-1]
MAENQKTKVVTGKVRLSYANVWEPRAAEEGQDPKYSLCILIPKSDTATLRKVKAAIDAAKEAGKSLWGGKIPPNLKLPLRDGDIDRPDQPEYAGHFFLNANSKQKPGIVDKNVNPILDQSEVYSGCYGRVSVNFFPFNQKGNKGVGCGLMNIQKVADGEPLSGRTRPEDDFEAIDDGDVEEDFLS